jgi:hypothetical protein
LLAVWSPGHARQILGSSESVRSSPYTFSLTNTSTVVRSSGFQAHPPADLCSDLILGNRRFWAQNL